MIETAQDAGPRPARPTRRYALVFHGCWLFIILWAAWERFSLPTAPLADKDAWGYLGPALTKLSGGAFAKIEGRGFLYPGFLYLVIGAFRQMSAVTLIQHVLGLVTGLLLLNVWLISRRFLFRPIIPSIVHDFAGLGLMALYLLSSQSMVEEHFLRAESLLPFFTALCYFLIVRFLLAKHVDHQPERTLVYGAAAIMAAFVLPLLKPSYTLSSILVTLPVWWHLFDRRTAWKLRLGMVAGPVLLAWLLLWSPEKEFSKDSPREDIWLPASLFVIHAPQIRDQMARDVDRDEAASPCTRDQLRAILQLLDTEIELSRPRVHHTFASLGFHPDYLLYKDSFCQKLKSILPERADQAAFYRNYFRRTWLHSPGAMLRKFFTQLWLFYGLKCPVYDDLVTNFASTYRDTFKTLSHPDHCYHIVSQVPAAVQYVSSLAMLAKNDLAAPQPRLVEFLLVMLSRMYLPGLIAALAAFVLFAAKKDFRHGCGRLTTIVAVGYAWNLGNAVAIALFHTLGVGRYSHVQLATTMLTQFLSLAFVIEVFGAVLRPRAIKSRSPQE